MVARDWDMIRDILLEIEKSDTRLTSFNFSELPPEDSEKFLHNLESIDQAGFVSYSEPTSDSYAFFGLSWQGHDFLDTIRDPEIWRKTKNGAKSVGSTSFEVMKQIGTAVATKAVEKIILGN